MDPRTAPKKPRTLRKRVARNRSIDKRSGRSFRKTTSPRIRSSSGKSVKIPRWTIFLVWITAASALGGLIYWGKYSSHQPTPRVEVPVKNHGSSPEKTPYHRERPKGGEAQSRTTDDIDRRPSATSGEKRDPESRSPLKPRQSPEATSHDTPASNHYASQAPEPGSAELPKFIPPPQPPSPTLTPPVAKVSIVIDDFGQNLEIAKRFLELPIPITLSILPYERYSQEVAALAHHHHRQVLLHLPMEPKGYPKVAPGNGALLLSMSEDVVQRSVGDALEVSPYFSGVNNHMGSHFTENSSLMKAALEEVHRRGLFFIDSYTSPRSVASSIAQQLHLSFRRRDVFLDNNPSEEAVRAQLRQFLRRAKIQGSALAIGHPYESTLRALSHEVELFSKENIAVVPAGELMEGS
jgi:uncharacterized protein